jgi:hypothetical protein
MFLLNTTRPDGSDFKKEGGVVGSSEDRGPQGSAVLEGDGVRSRPLRRKRTGACRRHHRCLPKTSSLHVQAGSREALPHKKRTAVWWPRRGRRRLRLHQEPFRTAAVDRTVAGFTRTLRDTVVAGVGGPGSVRREISNKEVARK